MFSPRQPVLTPLLLQLPDASYWEVHLGPKAHISPPVLPGPFLICFFFFSFFLEWYLIELVFLLHNYWLCLKVECKRPAGWGF